MLKKILVLVMLVMSFFSMGCGFDYKEYTDSKYAKAKERILDGMNDPDSYVKVEAKYTETGDALRIKFRGKNGFGGVVTKYSYIFYDKEGNIKEFYVVNNSMENDKLLYTE